MQRFHTRHDAPNATVELSSKLPAVGETVEFEVRLTAATGDATVRNAELALQVPYRTAEGYRRATVDRFELADELSTEGSVSEARTEMVDVSHDTPGTFGSVDVWASVAFALDGRPVESEEYFELKPAPQFDATFDGMVHLGFAPRSIECLADSTSDGQPFVRRIAFRPVDGPFRDRFDEVELFVRGRSDGIAVFVATDRGESQPVPPPRADRSECVVRHTDAEAVRDRLWNVIERHAGE